MGPAAILLSLAILVSAMASINSTAISPARTLLAMSHYGALPPAIKKVHPKYKSPHVALLLSSIVASVFYAVMRFISEDVLWDTITALGMMVCLLRHHRPREPLVLPQVGPEGGRGAVFSKIVLPGLGGVLLLIVFVKTTIDAMDPAATSGSNIAGIGLVGLIGVAVLGIGGADAAAGEEVARVLQWQGACEGRRDARHPMLETFDDGLSG